MFKNVLQNSYKNKNSMLNFKPDLMEKENGLIKTCNETLAIKFIFYFIVMLLILLAFSFTAIV